MAYSTAFSEILWSCLKVASGTWEAGRGFLAFVLRFPRFLAAGLGGWAFLRRGRCVRSLRFGEHLCKMCIQLVEMVGQLLLQMVPEIGDHRGNLCCELIEALDHLLLEFGESFIHSRKDSGRSRFWFPVRVWQMQIDLALFRNRDELLFRDILPARIGGVNLLRCVNPILREPFEKGFGVGVQQRDALGKSESAAHRSLSFMLD